MNKTKIYLQFDNNCENEFKLGWQLHKIIKI